MNTADLSTFPRTMRSEQYLAERLATAGAWVLRYGLAFLLILWGMLKFAAWEAEGIRPLVENSPFLGWLYDVLSVRATSALVGVSEVVAGVLIAARPWLPRASAYGSLLAAAIFLVTLSFLFTTPGALRPTSPFNLFLMKDLMMLGAALLTAADALRAARPAHHIPFGGARS